MGKTRLLIVDDHALVREGIIAFLKLADDIQVVATARSQLSLKLAREIRSIVQLAEIPPGLTSDQFLEAVYLAYQKHFLADLTPE